MSIILTKEGYVTLAGTTPTYYYYLKDHQGNNRVVINQSGVQQVNHYYPFGGLFGEGIQTSNQRYKYSGKELDRFQGLDMYDHGARHYGDYKILGYDRYAEMNRNRLDILELRAIKSQMNHPTWSKTSEVYRTGIMKYGERNWMIFPTTNLYLKTVQPRLKSNL